jgi:hypothetical protein
MRRLREVHDRQGALSVYVKEEKGQTLIETVFILAILLILIFGVAEFARAWYLKNSLNNAARVGARVAVILSPLNATTDPDGVACGAGSGALKKVIDAVCLDAVGVNSADRTVKIIVAFDDSDSDGKANSGDLVTVQANLTFGSGKFSVFSSLIPGLSNLAELSSQASMRYELS